MTPADRLQHLREARHDLKFALEHVRLAAAPYTHLKIRAAIRSLDGAIRHADGRALADDRGEPKTTARTRVRRPRQTRGVASHDNTALGYWGTK